MNGYMFAIGYILLVYLVLGFFKVAKNGSYEAYRVSAKQTEYMKRDRQI